MVLIQSPQVVKVPEGETVKFLCDLQSEHVDHTVDKYDVGWYYPESKESILSHYVDGRVYRVRGLSDRFQPSRDVAGNSYILTVSDVKLGDSAVYICGIWGTIFGNGTRLNVTSANAPVLIQSPSLERVTEGQTARLQCTMRNAAVTHTDVHWDRELPGKDMERVLTHDIKNNTQRSPGFTERFHPSRDTANKTFILTISNVQPSDTAVYYCSVWGDISGNGSQLNVTSANAPVLIQSPSVERVTEGQTARLQCTMRNAAVTHTDVHWNRELPGKDMERVLTHDIKNNTQRSPGFTERFHPSRDTSNKTFILTISNVQPSDTAVYYCSVWGDISGNGSQLSVTSAAAPVVIQSPVTEPIRQGQSARLQCILRNAAVTHTDVHWYRQQPGYIEWILTHEIMNNTRWGPGFSQRFQPSRDTSNNSFILTISNIQPSDAAVYYCEVRGDIDWSGTQLTVMSSRRLHWLTDADVEAMVKTGKILTFCKSYVQRNAEKTGIEDERERDMCPTDTNICSV
ncbi:polymeric immunoglobulin receptor-like [Scyliorhinus canicula]|uniref:polymeric immunoglobulin receptor-like n=1 Tax=Scyliorhinus canicula TaxID=7830 RepID=UPI0018F5720D|nr:polymeric immunoglobulin receptor-like [Scyliorhinus canicula]